MPNQYYPNNIIRFTNTMTSSGGLTINPTSVYAAVFFDSVSSIAPGNIVNPTSGFFYFDFEVETPGILGYRWRTEGSHKSESFGAVQVNSEPFA